ncbi:3-isopropylmalate dehydratase small subunit [Tistrella bauzanensis]|uniref:3-isopropylmalate dehydratase n=1 Tax=Tistrella arctica TaxID=3133430 RepID=A0ABU9YQP0_9PROT
MFDPVIRITGPAAPLPAANLDTDVIIRIERLTAGDDAGLGRWAFESIRYRADGSDDPAFPLNDPRWRAARILLAGPNFGCGSSREPAVNAILLAGIRCVIAPGFGDIFHANCFQNGLLPIRMPPDDVARLMGEAETGADFTVDLESCSILSPSGVCRGFDIDPARREALMAGLDDMGLTLRHADDIAAWQRADSQRRPWVWAHAHG